MAKVYKCVVCNHASAVKSNFKGTSSGRFFCNSVKRPECEYQRQYEVRHEQERRQPKFKFMEGWK